MSISKINNEELKMIHMLHTMKQIKRMFNNCDGLLIVAGTEMSSESGLTNVDSLYSIFEFLQEPISSWKYICHNFDLYRNTEPHHGFKILQHLGNQFEQGCFVVTSNFDGQFQKAGFDAEKIYEVNGNFNWSQCSIPCSSELVPTPIFDYQNDVDYIPKCHICGAVLRPNTQLHIDNAWNSKLFDSQKSKFKNWTNQCKNILCIEIGADASNSSLRIISEQFFKNLIRINPKDFKHSHPNVISLPLKAKFGIDLIQYAIQEFE